MKSLFLVILILSQTALWAQNGLTTYVKGRIDDAKLQEIRIAVFEDYFSLKPNILAKAKIKDLQFKLEFNIDKPYVARLYGGLYDKQLILEPGMEYEVYVRNDSTQRLKIVQNNAGSEINKLYVDLLFHFDEFISKNDMKIVRGQYTKEILQFTQNLKDSLQNEMKNPLIADFINYRCAELEIAGRAKSRSKIYVDYLYKEPIHIYGAEFMAFVKDFYGGYFYENYIKNSSEPIRNIIKNQMGWTALSKAFDSIPYYGNKSDLRDLALLVGLSEALYDKDNFDPENIWFLFREAAKKNENEQIRVAATNFLEKYAPLKKGMALPIIDIINEKNKSLSLQSFIGKPIYLCFFDPFTETSTIEISSLSYLYEKYKNSIHFVPVAVKASAYELQEFKLGNGITVPLYRTENVEDLIPFRIRSTIAFFTINAKGEFVNGNGPMPLFADSELEALSAGR